VFERLRKIDPVFVAIGILILVVWAVLIPLLLL